MMEDLQQLKDRKFTVALINAHENPVAVIDEKSFKGDWHWIRVPPSWKPGDPLPADSAALDALIVFATKRREEETSSLCRVIRGDPALSGIPLLVAVDQYQMPLANQVREIPNADFVITPIEERSLIEHLTRAVESRE